LKLHLALLLQYVVFLKIRAGTGKNEILSGCQGKVKPAPLDYGKMNILNQPLPAGGCLTKAARRSIIERMSENPRPSSVISKEEHAGKKHETA
jgi:hypothetical protein